MNHVHADEITDQGGSYTLLFQLELPLNLPVGRLGSFYFPKATYLYFGSAYGPGGLRARLQRHISGNGRPHWHIDTLRSAATLKAVFFIAAPLPTLKPSTRLECMWSQAAARLPSAFIPAPRFGASDCQQRCSAHLIGLSKLPDPLTDWLAHAAGEEPMTLITIPIR